ncbi:MAG TPA: rhomboid family intramembrane serine protease [Gemmatimonadaceae bacterium]|jgi:membrane associated rhomboid family serine protease|nr:rhomboid family intramembrane serine protease [Gemmatimonadaceae bacterium]
MASYPIGNEQESQPQPQRLTAGVQALIVSNLAVAFLQAVGVLPYADLAAWFGFDLGSLPSRWWTPITYMFVHVGVWHVLANMYGLYLFGPRLERTLGSKKFAWFYVFCGLGGVVFQMLFIRTGGLVGASAAVFGVMTAYAMQWPDDEIYLMFVLPMRVRTLVVALFVFNLVMGVVATGDGGGTNIAYFAHVGGVIAAYAYMRMAASTGIDQVRQRVASLPDADEPPRAIPRNLPRRERGDEVDDIVAKSKAIAAKRAVTLAPSSRRREAKADELNRVLDKISETGIESLTGDERKVLEEMSRRLRGH